MRRIVKLAIAPALAVALLLGVAGPAFAQQAPSDGPEPAPSCTDQYAQCLNDSWDTKGFFRVLADMECLAEYIGCVARKGSA